MQAKSTQTPKKQNRPVFTLKTGYKITKGDVTVTTGETVFTTAGYTNITAAIRLALANQHLAILKTVVTRGIPRVYVDNGHITSKVDHAV